MKIIMKVSKRIVKAKVKVNPREDNSLSVKCSFLKTPSEKLFRCRTKNLRVCKMELIHRNSIKRALYTTMNKSPRKSIEMFKLKISILKNMINKKN